MYIKKILVRKTSYAAILILMLFFQSNICLAEKTLQSTVFIDMYDNYFSPQTITISVGQKITWINKGKKDHTVTSAHGYFSSGHIRPGSSVSYTFTKPGTYYYKCTIHTFMFFGMKGKIVVK